MLNKLGEYGGRGRELALGGARRVIVATPIAVLIFCLAAGERLGAAAGMRASLEATTTEPSDTAAWLTWPVWVGAIVVGAGLAVLVAVLLDRKVEVLRKRRQADPSGVRWFAGAAILFWAVWQALACRLYFHPQSGAGGAAAFFHLLAIAAALLALGAAGRAIGDVREGWRRATVVRLQLLVLAALVVAFFLVDVLAGQVADVLRAWGDGPISRVAYGIGAAIVLGGLVRSSSRELLFPERWRKKFRTGVSLVAAGVGSLAGVAFVLGLTVRGWDVAQVGAAAIAAIVGTTFGVSKWCDPERQTIEDNGALERLPDTLGLVPVGILFAGLSAALMDTALLGATETGGLSGLIAATVAAGLVLSVLVAVAYPSPNVSTPPVSVAGNASTAGARTTSAPNATSPRNKYKCQATEPEPVAGEGRARRVILKFAAFAVAGIAAGWAVDDGPGADFAACVLAVAALTLATGVLDRWAKAQISAAGGALLGTVIAVGIDPIGGSRAFGAVGIALVGLTGVLLALHLAGSIAIRRGPRCLFARAWLPRRLPVIAMLALWIGVAWAGNPEELHQARTVQGAQPRLKLETEVHRWLDRRLEHSKVDQPLPMVLLAASGGGSKAAYWTDLVLDCLAADRAPKKDGSGECRGSSDAGRRRLGHLFLTSSVSGGSVGIYHFMLNRPRLELGKAWIADSAGVEVLSPIVAWGFFHDLPAFMLGATLDPGRCRATDNRNNRDERRCVLHADRAVAQEVAVSGVDDGDIVPRDRRRVRARGDGPVTIFNAALDGANGRVLISPLELSPPRVRGCDTGAEGKPAAGSMDGHDMLAAGRDVPLVTAALLTARFPVVAPAARLGDTKVKEDTRGCESAPSPLPPAKLRDGGYVENSGLLTITELLPTIARAIESWTPADGRPKPRVPVIVVSVDDDPVVACPAPRLDKDPRRPLGISSKAGPGYFTRLARDRLESGQYEGVQYVRLSPAPHVGARAATGWELSKTVRREDLVGALSNARPGGTTGGRPDAGMKLQRLRDVIDGKPGKLSCDAG